MSTRRQGDKRWSLFGWHSTETETPYQRLKRIPHYLLRVLAELAVKLRVIVRIHPTLKHLRGGRPIKELSGDAQCADAITGSPCGTDFVGLAIHLSSGANSQTAGALA
jgi:hypothetical protein